MAAVPVQLQFLRGADGAVVDAMDELHAAQRGWVNIVPEVDEEDEPPARPGLWRLIGASGPAVPFCTWVAPDPSQRPPHAEIGIQHASGTKAATRLAEHSRGVPDRWVVLADHPKRGLVVAVNPAASNEDALRWLLDAAEVLTRTRLNGSWRAEVHRV